MKWKRQSGKLDILQLKNLPVQYKQEYVNIIFEEQDEALEKVAQADYEVKGKKETVGNIIGNIKETQDVWNHNQKLMNTAIDKKANEHFVHQKKRVTSKS